MSVKISLIIKLECHKKFWYIDKFLNFLDLLKAKLVRSFIAPFIILNIYNEIKLTTKIRSIPSEHTDRWNELYALIS